MTTVRRFTFDDIYPLVLNTIERRGRDFTYVKNSEGKCSYAVREGDELVGSCWVGDVLHQIDPSILVNLEDAAVLTEAWSQLTAHRVLSNSKRREYRLFDRFDIVFTEDARDFLCILQREQDEGRPYARALMTALSCTNHVDELRAFTGADDESLIVGA